MSSESTLPSYMTVVERQVTTEDEPCYIAWHPELSTCLGQGDTPEEAVQDLAEATALALEHLTAHGLPVPQPQTLGLVSKSQPSATLYSIQVETSAPFAVTQHELVFRQS